jgi:ribonuclease D
MNFFYITSKEALKEASEEWKKEKELGIDLECENNLHHYGVYISLVQISSKTKHWIIDILQIENDQPLVEMLRDPDIQKIFHDFSFDLRVIQHQWQCHPKNIFDTQLAALFLGKKDIGLGPLLEEYFGIEKERKFQKADWTKRPLSLDMLAYAAKDSQYLIPLRDKLKDELKKKKRLIWVKEELANIEKKGLDYKQGTYLDLRGAKLLSGKEKSILKKLFSLRESLAKKVDRPSYFVMNNKKLMGLVQEPPHSIENWRRIHGVHPIVKKNAAEFFQSVRIASQKEIKIPKAEKKRFSGKQKKQIHDLNQLADALAARYKIKRHLILNKEQIKDIILSKTHRSLRDWQKKLIIPYN